MADSNTIKDNLHNLQKDKSVNLIKKKKKIQELFEKETNTFVELSKQIIDIDINQKSGVGNIQNS